MNPASSFLCRVLCLFALSLPGLAQSRVAQVGGRVSDQSGAVLPGVLVILTDETTGHIFKTVSTGTGDFLIDFLSAGRYMLTAELAGFTTFRAEGIRIAVEQVLDVPVVLKVGAPDQQITVTADPNRIETTNAALKFSIPGKQLADLPILTATNSRSALTSLLLMTPGSSSNNPAFPANLSRISINGSPTNTIGLSINGIDATSLSGGVLTSGPNPDALSEYSVVAQNGKAESGTFPVNVNLETKRGGDHFHGQVRALMLNPDLNARDFFDLGKKSVYSINALGFQLSGPLLLPGLHGGGRKTFFFLDQETTSSRLGYTDQATVLSEAERAGDFSSLPAEQWPTDPLTGSPFPGGRIPSARILPQSRLFVENIMAHPTSDDQVISPYSEKPGGAEGTVRVDHQFSAAATVNASLFYRQSWYTEDVTTIQHGRVEAPGHNYSFAVQASYSFSHTAVNSFKFGQTSGFGEGLQNGPGLGIEPKAAGFNITTRTRGAVGFPIVDLFETGFAPGGQSWSSRESEWTVKDDFVFGRRSHFMKFGGEMRWLRATNWDNWSGTPQFSFASFTPGGSGNDAADFLLGIPNGYAQATDSANDPRRLHTSLYFQDDFKLRSNLTLNLGIRYELSGVWTDANGHNARFVPGARSSVFPKAPAGAIYPGDMNPTTGENLGTNLNPSDYDNFGPRLGIAWSPGIDNGWIRVLTGGPGHSSVRAGYGIHYIYSRGDSIGGLANVPPWFTFASRDAFQLAETGGTFLNPWGSSPDPFAGLVQGRDFVLPLGSMFQTDPSLIEPYQQQWNLSLQRQLPRDLTIQVAYLGNKALHLHRTYEANPGVLTADATYSNVGSRRQYPDFSGVTGYVSDGVSTYHALQGEVSRRFARRLLFNANYIWSKALDNVSPGSGLPGGFAGRNITSWGPSNADSRHALLFNGVVELPGIRGVKVIDRLLSGWQAATIVQLRSGLPIKIINPVDSLLLGDGPQTPDITGPFRKLNPRDIYTFKMPNGRTVTGNFFFDPTVFRPVMPSSPAEARPGNLGRNVFTGPGVANVDMNLLKRFSIRDRHSIDLRIDTTNVFNHAQFVLYRAAGVSVTDPFFGRALRTSGPRRVQFFVRYSF